MKGKILYTGLSILLALCTLVCLLATVITLLPPAVTEVTVKESVSVSSSALDEKTYVSQISGALLYEGDAKQLENNQKGIILEEVRITVSDGKVRDTVVLRDVRLPTRMAQALSHEWESDVAFDRVEAVAVVFDGEEATLSNQPDALIELDTLVFAILTLGAALVTVWACKQRYYVAEEEKMIAKK